MIFLYVYTLILIGNFTLSIVTISVAALNWGTKHSKRYGNV